MKEMKIGTIIIVYFIITLAIIWGLAITKMMWSNVEVDVYLDDGDYLFVDEEGDPFKPLEVHLDSRYYTFRTAIFWSWVVLSVLTVLMIWLKMETEYDENANGTRD